MDNFTAFDLVAALIVAVSSILAYYRGFIRESMSILGWIIAAVVAYFSAPLFHPLISDIPVVGEFFAGSCEMSVIAAFAIVMAATLVVLSILTMLVSQVAKMPGVNALNAGAGFLFGAARGVLLVVLILIINDAVIPGGTFSTIENSQSKRVLSNIQGTVVEQGSEVNLESVKRLYTGFTAICGSLSGQAPDVLPDDLPDNLPDQAPDPSAPPSAPETDI